MGGLFKKMSERTRMEQSFPSVGIRGVFNLGYAYTDIKG